MIHRIKRLTLLSLLILSYLLFSYNYFNGWWYSSIGTILVLIFSYLIWKNDFLKHIGLQLNVKRIVSSFLLAAVITICSALIMRYIAGKHDVIINPSTWHNYYHDVFYILNEEIVIGAMLLFGLVHKKKIRPLVASVGLAVFFALIHFVFYKWIFLDRGIIGIVTLTTLFMVGFVRNSLILMTGHIGYSWALHYGWMIVMMGSIHTYMDTELWVTESEKFNMYLGSFEMLIISATMAVLTGIYWFKRPGLRPLIR